jgi:fungal STAND N-terminal Goodbye domain
MTSTTTSSNYQCIFDAALTDYAKQTGIDLITHPFVQSLQTCDSADAILNLFEDKAKEFRTYRDGNRKSIDCLKPVVQVLHTVAGILGEVATLVSLANRFALSDRIFMALFPGTVPTNKGNPRWRRCALHCASSPYLPRLYRVRSPYSRPLLELVQVTTLLSICLNALGISLIDCEFIPRSRSPLQYLV